MNSVDEIKAAAAQLKPEEQFELYQWLDNSKHLQKLRFDRLKKEIEEGLDDLAQGRASTYDEPSLDTLALEIKDQGRSRLVDPNP